MDIAHHMNPRDGVEAIDIRRALGACHDCRASIRREMDRCNDPDRKATLRLQYDAYGETAERLGDAWSDMCEAYEDGRGEDDAYDMAKEEMAA